MRAQKSASFCAAARYAQKSRCAGAQRCARIDCFRASITDAARRRAATLPFDILHDIFGNRLMPRWLEITAPTEEMMPGVGYYLRYIPRFAIVSGCTRLHHRDMLY